MNSLSLQEHNSALALLKKVYIFDNDKHAVTVRRNMYQQVAENSKMNQVEPNLFECFTNLKYRTGTFVTCFLACSYYWCGAPVVPMVSNAIFISTSINPGVANLSMAFVSLVGSCFGPFAAIYLNSKKLF